jgi:hypothetical protein
LDEDLDIEDEEDTSKPGPTLHNIKGYRLQAMKYKNVIKIKKYKTATKTTKSEDKISKDLFIDKNKKLTLDELNL